MCIQFLPHAVGESIGGIDEDEVEAALAASHRGMSERTRSARSPRPSRSTLPRAGRVSLSTSTASAAPRESASMPSAPVPQ